MMAQAAGKAIAQSICTGQPANDLDIGELVTRLRQAGACLPQMRLSRDVTRP
jgi:hypothetical protein